MSVSDVSKSGKYFYLMLIFVMVLVIGALVYDSRRIPNLLGEWRGINQTVSDLKGFREWEKTVYITEQKDRRFSRSFRIQ